MVYCTSCGSSNIKIFNDYIRPKDDAYTEIEFRDLQLLCSECNITTSAVLTRKV